MVEGGLSSWGHQGCCGGISSVFEGSGISSGGKKIIIFS